jgi:type I restriction enzyme S subunit
MDVTPGFKRTLVGTVPSDWLDYTIGDLIAFEGGSQPDKSAFRTSSKPGYVRLIQIRDYRTDKYETYIPVHLARRSCNERDIMIGRYGPPVFQILRGLAGAYNVALIKATPERHVSHTYAYYFLKQEKLLAFIENLSQRSSGQTGVDLKELRQYPFPLPPTKAEQEAIAEALSDADALIESLERLIAKLCHLRQGAISALLTGKRRLTGFSEKWTNVRIAEIATPNSEKNASSEDLPVLTCSKHFGFVDSLSYFKNQVFSKDTSTYKIIRRGQIRYPSNHVEEGSIGIQNLYEVALVSPIYVVFSVNEGVVSGEFLHSVLKQDSYRRKFKTATSSSVDRRGSLRWPTFSEITVDLPSINEQTAIASLLSDMGKEVLELDAMLGKYRLIKRAMMDSLLTGKIRLPETHLRKAKEHNVEPAGRHNWQFNEAVLISVLVKHFGSEQYPLGRMRYTKLSYLFHRHVKGQVEGYRKKAAGPYNPDTRYKGPETIAQKNRYIRAHRQGNLTGFIRGPAIADAEAYFFKWYGNEALIWLEQFRYRKNDDLERLATVDMAMQDLLERRQRPEREAVRALIASEPEWNAKLNRAIFSDAGIDEAIAECRTLFRRTPSERS